jgi:hypothetical protein
MLYAVAHLLDEYNVEQPVGFVLCQQRSQDTLVWNSEFRHPHRPTFHRGRCDRSENNLSRYRKLQRCRQGKNIVFQHVDMT